MLEVGLIASFRGPWQGGANYVRNLLDCYRKYPDPHVHLNLFIDHPEDASEYRSDAVGVHALSTVIPRGLASYSRRLGARVLGYDPAIMRILKRQKIELLTHYPLAGPHGIKTLFWQPDFQHRFYPQFFAPGELLQRDAAVQEAGRWGNILLSSHAAADDFRRFYPELSATRTHILHFSSGGMLDVTPLPRAELARLYPVSEPYFFLPNQFWKHKNHTVVLQALRMTQPHIRVVCTGRTDDYRDPTYAPNLFQEVKDAGLTDRFISLGSVPYPMLVSLMHYSVAVLQPSLFEGWSTSVEESKAMRKRILLSDLAVHIEQAPGRGTFFPAHSAEALAAHMQQVYDEFDPEIEAGYAAGRLQYKPELERSWITTFADIMKTVGANIPGTLST